MGGKKHTNCESYYICLKKFYPYLRGKECDSEETQMLFSELDLETCDVRDS